MSRYLQISTHLFQEEEFVGSIMDTNNSSIRLVRGINVGHNP